MRKEVRWAVALVVLALLASVAIAGCAPEEPVDEEVEAPVSEEVGEGTLVFVADGEEHARDGTSSKDGWDITFEHLYVTLGDITTYQTDPPYDTDDGWDLEYEHKVELPGVHTIDLADSDSDPAIVGEVDGAVAGHYNATSWSMLRADSGPSEGYAIMFVGTAEKDGEVVDFTLRFDREIAYQGGEYVGDVRKGILEGGGEAEIEMTFHVDHFFGRADKDPDDDLNVAALGFDPLAAAAVGGSLDVSLGDLEDLLSAEDYAKLEDILVHFGHVGEGHCLAKPLS